jgi:DNA polymerase III alpha subunit
MDMEESQKMKVIKSRDLGERELVDIEVDNPCHNFILSNGLVASNSHSIAYSALTAITIYLKYKFPTQFFLGNLKMTNNKGEQQSEVGMIQREMVRENIELLPPHIGKSKIDFSLEDKSIRHGIACIRGIKKEKKSKLDKLLETFDSKYEILINSNEAKIDVTTLIALTRCGFFDNFIKSRNEFSFEIQYWNKLTKEKNLLIQYNIDERIDIALEKIATKTDENGKPLVAPSRMETIRKNTLKYKKMMEINSKHEGYSNWYFERHYLGYSFSNTLKKILEKKYQSVYNIPEIKKAKFRNGEKIRLGCEIIEKPFIGISKRDNKYLRYKVADDFGTFTIMLVGEDEISLCETNNGKLPDKGDIVVIKGSPNKERTSMFCENIGIIPNKVLTRTSQVK